MKIIKLIALPLIFVSILFTSCSKEEEDITPEATIIEYNYDLGVITPNSPTSPKIVEAALTSYSLSLSHFFTEYSSIKDKITSISFTYEDIYSIESSNIGFDDIDLFIRCDYKTYQQNENSFLITIIDSDNTTHQITVTFKLFYEETFKLVRALINNSRNNSLKLTIPSGLGGFTGADLFHFDMDLVNSDYKQQELTFKFVANSSDPNSSQIFLSGSLWDAFNVDGNYANVFISIQTLPTEKYTVWQYDNGTGDDTSKGTLSINEFEVNGNTVTGIKGTWPFTFTLN